MLIQAFNHPKKVVFLYMRNLNQLVFMIMCKKVVARSHGLRNVPMKVTGKHLIKVILMRQASHELTIIDLVYLSQRSEIQWLVVLIVFGLLPVLGVKLILLLTFPSSRSPWVFVGHGV